MVVVASQRKSGISEFLLGSVAAHCAQHSPRPVLVLHAPQPAGSQGSDPGLLGRLASAAAAALGGRPEEAEQQRAAAAAAAAAAEEQRRQQMRQPACSVGRHVILAVDDSGEGQEAVCWRVASVEVVGGNRPPRGISAAASVLAVHPATCCFALAQPAGTKCLPMLSRYPSRGVRKGVQLGATAPAAARGHVHIAAHHSAPALPVRLPHERAFGWRHSNWGHLHAGVELLSSVLAAAAGVQP